MGILTGSETDQSTGIISQLKGGLGVKMYTVIHTVIMIKTDSENLRTVQTLAYPFSTDLGHWETFRGGEYPPP